MDCPGQSRLTSSDQGDGRKGEGEGEAIPWRERLTSRIDTTAHKGAQRLFVAGLSVGAIYWGAVIRWSESIIIYTLPSLVRDEFESERAD